jgi:hypothetical protein
MAATRRKAPTPNGKLNSAQSKVVSRSLNTLSIQALNKWVQTALEVKESPETVEETRKEK